MAYEKGKPKTGGRKSGTPNKATKELRQRVMLILENNWESIEEDLNALTPKERIDSMLKLLEFGLPKLNRSEVTDTASLGNLLSMTPEQRRAKINELKAILNQ